MFEQKMQEIENDVVPFGLLTMDLRQYEQIENQDDPWR